MTDAKILSSARKSFAAGKTRPIEFRKKQLQQLLNLFIEREDEILNALRLDMRKSRQEALLYEVEMTKREIKHMLRNIDSYAAVDRLPTNLLAVLDHGYIQPEPYGLVLILGAWNYPFLLSCKPLIGAIAAGNVVVVKPSEIAPHSSEVLAKRIPEYLDPSCYYVVEGDVEATKSLLANQFDYIFCTGSTAVGKSILAEAAKNLTPCTLELGGKSPCFIHESADFKLAAKRILWGKLINLGQTCIAPDYILCSKEAEIEFLQVANQVLKEWYGEADLQTNPDLPRIINKKHFQRLDSMLSRTKGQIAFGGKRDVNDLWIEPTIVSSVTVSDSTMEEEIFGPILPIITVNDWDEAADLILTKPKPLAFYVFSKDASVTMAVLNKVSSGSVCVNDCVWQNGWDGLPFGGVGNSGMGSYHGKFSFDTFSHKKSVLHRGFSYLSEKLGESRYPPYTKAKLDIFKTIVNNFHHFDMPKTSGFAMGFLITSLLTLAVVVAAACFYKY